VGEAFKQKRRRSPGMNAERKRGKSIALSSEVAPSPSAGFPQKLGAWAIGKHSHRMCLMDVMSRLAANDLHMHRSAEVSLGWKGTDREMAYSTADASYHRHFLPRLRSSPESTEQRAVWTGNRGKSIGGKNWLYRMLGET
jgi:hypothetical protein